MKRAIISTIIAILILVCGAVYETDFIKRQFEEMSTLIDLLYEKADNESATEDDVIAVRENWREKKRYLHAFIPHNEIKEIDLWISESIKLVKDKQWSDAISKIEVLKNLTHEIPSTFMLRLENVL